MTDDVKPLNWYREMVRETKDTNQILADILKELVTVRELLVAQDEAARYDYEASG